MHADQLTQDVYRAMKGGDAVRVGTLRFLLSEIKNAAIAKYGADADKRLTEGDVADAIKKQVKRHKESIAAYGQAGRQDLVTKERAELAVLMDYMSKQLSDEELEEILVPVAKSGETNFGLLMKQAIAAVKGQADGRRVSVKLKELLERNKRQETGDKG